MAGLVGKDAGTADDRYAIVATRFHADVVDALIEGCVARFAAAGVPRPRLDLARVPGAFELPLACQAHAASGRYAGVIALGCVVRGETSHYDHVASEACHGVMEAGLRTGVPVILGVLTVENLEQARHRASLRALRGSAPDPAAAAGATGKAAPESNKGWECAEAALEMATLLRRLHATPSA
jgi:6,7-dimethyl-8-ribityllumazine synthase